MKLHPGFELSCRVVLILFANVIIVYDIVAIVVTEVDIICHTVLLYYCDDAV